MPSTIFAFSSAGKSTRVSGPQKVFRNLEKGLRRLDVELVNSVSPPPQARIWIHDDWQALYSIRTFSGDIVLGPNLTVLPRYLPKSVLRKAHSYLMPSLWSAAMWAMDGYPAEKLKVWPAGIDTEEFCERPKGGADQALIYFKERYPFELHAARKVLDDLNIKYSLITYGKYNELDFKRQLERTKWCLWIGRQESQGIALQEILATGVPVLVWDVLTPFQNNPLPAGLPQAFSCVPATAIPYFCDSAGLSFVHGSELRAKIVRMEGSWDTFAPRAFVERELSLTSSARQFLECFDTLCSNYETKKAGHDAFLHKQFAAPLSSRICAMARRVRNRFNSPETRTPRL